MTTKTVIINQGTTTFTVPSDFGSLVSINCIGAAGGSQSGSAGSFSGGAGGSGAFAQITTLAGIGPSVVYNCQVGLAGTSGATPTSGTATWFGSTTTVAADFGTAASGATPGTGGQASNSFGTTKTSGASGGAGDTLLGIVYSGGGGSGASGPSGAGAAGVAGVSVSGSAAGGNGDAGSGGAGATTSASAGANGAEWTTTIGSTTFGSGGGGASTIGSGGSAGGSYGASGGGGDASSIVGNSAGASANGVIAFIYNTSTQYTKTLTLTAGETVVSRRARALARTKFALTDAETVKLKRAPNNFKLLTNGEVVAVRRAVAKSIATPDAESVTATKAVGKNVPSTQPIYYVFTASSTFTPTFWGVYTVECIGAGAGGGWVTSVDGYGAGGGGGAYSKSTGIVLPPGVPVSYTVGLGGAAAASGNNFGTAGGNTYFNGSSLASCMVGAQGGQPSTSTTGVNGGLGGAASSGTGAIKYSGGNGGQAPNTYYGPGGGGGAAGPGGNGGNGGDGANTAGGSDGGGGGGGGNGGGGSASAVGSSANGTAGGTSVNSTAGGTGGTSGTPTGGAGSQGSGGGGGYGNRSGGAVSSGGNGGAGVDMAGGLAGSGGGGGGNGVATTGAWQAGAGALYGGGGAGADGGSGTHTANNTGAQGVIVLTLVETIAFGETVSVARSHAKPDNTALTDAELVVLTNSSAKAISVADPELTKLNAVKPGGNTVNANLTDANSLAVVKQAGKNIAVTTVFDDAFNYASGDLATVSNGAWSRVGGVSGDITVVSSGVLQFGDGTNQCVYLVAAQPPNHYVKATLQHVNNQSGLCVRATSFQHCIYVDSFGGQYRIVLFNGGSSNLATTSNVGASVGDVWLVTAVGTTISLYVNGGLKLTATSSVGQTNTGSGFYVSANDNAVTPLFNAFESGPVTELVQINKQVSVARAQPTLMDAEAVALVKQAGKLVAATDTEAVALTKQTAKQISTTNTEVVTVGRSVARVLALIDGQTLSLIKQAGKFVQLVDAETLALVKQASITKALTNAELTHLTAGAAKGKSLVLTDAELVTLTHIVNKVMATTDSESVQVVRQVGKYILTVEAELVNVNTGARTYTVMVSTTNSELVLVGKQVGKNISVPYIFKDSFNYSAGELATVSNGVWSTGGASLQVVSPGVLEIGAINGSYTAPPNATGNHYVIGVLAKTGNTRSPLVCRASTSNSDWVGVSVTSSPGTAYTLHDAEGNIITKSGITPHVGDVWLITVVEQIANFYVNGVLQLTLVTTASSANTCGGFNLNSFDTNVTPYFSYFETGEYSSLFTTLVANRVAHSSPVLTDSQLVQLSKLVGKAASVVDGELVGLVKQLSKNVGLLNSEFTAAVKASMRNIVLLDGEVTVLGANRARRLAISVVQAESVAIQKLVGHRVALTSPELVRLSKQAARSVGLTNVETVNLRKALQRFVGCSGAQLVIVSRAPGKRVAFVQAEVVTARTSKLSAVVAVNLTNGQVVALTRGVFGSRTINPNYSRLVPARQRSGQFLPRYRNAIASNRNRSGLMLPRYRSTIVPSRNRNVMFGVSMSEVPQLYPPIVAQYEQDAVTLDLGLLLNGATIASVLQMFCVPVGSPGQDPQSATRLIGDPIIVTPPQPPVGSGVPNSGVWQMVGNMVAGVSYTISAQVELSDGRTPVVSVVLPCAALGS